MTLPTGAIWASDVNVELGRAWNTPFSLDDSWVRALAGKPSGAISFADLRGQTAQPNWNGTPQNSGGPGILMNMAVPFFRGVTASIGGDNQTPINNLILSFSVAPNWDGNILFKNNSTGYSGVLVKRDAVTWWIRLGGNGGLRAGITDNFTLLPSN